MTFRDLLLSWMARKSTKDRIYLHPDLARDAGITEHRALSLMIGKVYPSPWELDALSSVLGIPSDEFYLGGCDSPEVAGKSSLPVVTARIRDLICRACKRKTEERCFFCRLNEAFALAEKVREGMETSEAIESVETNYYRELERINQAHDIRYKD